MKQRKREVVPAEGAVEGNLFLGMEPGVAPHDVGMQQRHPVTGWASHIEDPSAVPEEREIGLPLPDEPDLPP